MAASDIQCLRRLLRSIVDPLSERRHRAGGGEL
jgi:hypothetical protein